MTKELAISLLNNKNVYLTKKGKEALIDLVYNNKPQSEELYKGEALCTDRP